MLRNYRYGPLRNRNSLRLGQIRVPYSPNSIWFLPPKTVAYFAGELSRVMLDAAEQYVFEKTLTAAAKTFHREAERASLTHITK